LILALAPFVVFVNVTGITAIEETIGKGLNLNGPSLTMVVNITSIATAPLILFSGHLADRFERKRIYLWGCALFALGSLGAALSTGLVLMLVSRAIQGFGAGVVTALSLGLIAHLLGEKHRGLAIGFWGSGVGLGLALGPVLGATIAGAANLSWRYFFGLLAAATLVLLVLTLASIPSAVHRFNTDRKRIDFVGALLAAFGIVGVVTGVTYGGSWGWANASTLVAIFGGLALIIIFAIYETRRPFGVTRISAFKIPSYSLAGLVTVVNLMVVIGVFVYVGLQLQVNLNITSIREGLYYLPFSALVLLLSPLFGRLVDRFGPRPILLFVEIAAAMGLLYFAFLIPADNGHYSLLLPALVLLGLAAAGGAPATSTTLVGTRPRSEVGEASAINGTLVQIGSAIGAGVVIAIFSSQYPTSLVAGILGLHLNPSTTHLVLGAVASQHLSSLSPTLLARIIPVAHIAFSKALKPILILLAILSLVAAVASARISRKELEQNGVAVREH
jgi:MFS family permease